MSSGVGNRVAFLSARDAATDPEIRSYWDGLLVASDNPNVLFQSPDWLSNIALTRPGEEPSLACLRRPGGELLGLAPTRLRTDRLPLRFGRIRLLGKRANSVEILGGEPLLSSPRRPSDFDSLAHAILDARPDVDGLYFHMLRVGSPLWDHLTEHPSLRKRFVPVVKLASLLHLANLPGTFDELISRNSSKVRNNLRRCVRRLNEHAGGELRLERITRREQVPRFLRLGGSVARRSWQDKRVGWLIRDTAEWHDHLADLADRGLLRSYLLMCGETPCSYSLGFQGKNACYFKIGGYDPDFAEWRAGIALLYLQFQDLFLHDRPARMHLGFGDDKYKHVYSNETLRVAHLFLLRKTLWSRLKLAAERWGKRPEKTHNGSPDS